MRACPPGLGLGGGWSGLAEVVGLRWVGPAKSLPAQRFKPPGTAWGLAAFSGRGPVGGPARLRKLNAHSQVSTCDCATLRNTGAPPTPTDLAKQAYWAFVSST